MKFGDGPEKVVADYPTRCSAIAVGVPLWGEATTDFNRDGWIS
jgi:hypothetical protein